MSNSLKDQLIKAGLVTQEQADAADADKRRTRRDSGAGRGGKGAAGAGTSSKSGKGRSSGQGRSDQNRKGPPGDRSGARRGRGQPAGGHQRPVDDSPEAVKARALAQQRSRDERAVAALRKAAGSTEKALRDEMRRFIAQYDKRAKTAADSDEPYNFVHNRKIKRIHVPPAQLDALSVGELVIINNDGRYALLPFAPACTVGELDQRRIVTAHLSGED